MVKSGVSIILSVFLIGLMSVCYGQLSCYVGTTSAQSTQTNCGACQTTTTWFSSSVVNTVSSCAITCATADNTVLGAGTKTTCCNVSLCNPPNGTSPGGSSGSLKCYGDNMQVISGCQYCQKMVASLVVTTTVTRSCANSCLAINVGPVQTSCCQTDLCNGAGQKVASVVTFLSSVLVAIVVVKVNV